MEGRRVSANDGQDWPISKDYCLIPAMIKNIKELYAFTLRTKECLRPGATAFRDTASTKISAMWEVIHQQFQYLCENMKDVLIREVKQMNNDIGKDSVLVYYMEAILDKDKFLDDMQTSYCGTSCIAYTFWIAIKEHVPGRNIRMDVQKIYDEILNQATHYCKALSGDNARIIKKIIEKNFDYKDEEDEDEPDDTRRSTNRRKNINVDVKNLKKHERWKLLSHKEMLANVYDMMAHKEEWQTGRLDQLLHRSGSIAHSPTKVNTIFHPFTAIYARPTNCLINQSPHNLENIVSYDVHSKTWSLKFPMRAWVLRVPITLIGVESILNRKLLDYQMNCSYAVKKMLPIIMEELEEAIAQNAAIKTHMSNSKSSPVADSWDKHYDEYKAVMEYVMSGRDTMSDSDQDPLSEPEFGSYYDERDTAQRASNKMETTDSESEEELKKKKETFKQVASSMALTGKLNGSENTVKAVMEEIDRREREEREELINQARSYNDGIVNLIRQAQKVGMGDFVKSVAKKGNGKFSKLLESNLVNCTTVFADGIDTRDNTQDCNQFISVYAALAAQNSYGRKAIKNLEKRIEQDNTAFEGIENPLVVLRKCLLLLKKHMLREYKAKCLTTDAYGISPFEAAVLKYQQQHNPFEAKITYTKFDKDLGILENRECREYAKYCTTVQLATLSRLFSVARQYSADATRNQANTMRLCMILFSRDAGVGKSEIEKKLIEYGIEGMFLTQAYMSSKSDVSSETSFNAGTRIWPEIPGTMLDDSDPNNDQASRLKNIVTSGESTATRLVKDPATNNFVNVNTRTEQHTSIFGSTNLNMRNTSGPIASRFYMAPVYRDVNPWREILQAMAAEEMLRDSSMWSQEEFKKQTRFMQVMIYHVERMIQVGILDDVQTDIAWIFMTVLQRMLKTKGIKIPNVRVSYSTVILARQKRIVSGIEENWLHKGAKYNGQNITMDQFLDLDPKLAITTSDIVSAIGETYDRIINPDADLVRRCIYKKFTQEKPKNGRFRRVMTFNKIQVGKSNKEVRVEKAFAFDYNYIKFPMYGQNGIEDFCKEISQISATLGGVILPWEAVQAVINSWVECKLDCPKYAYIPTVNNKQVYGMVKKDEDGNEEEPDLADIVPDIKREPGDKRPTSYNQSIVEVGGKTIFFLYHYFKEPNPEPPLTTLKNTIVEILSCAHQLGGRFVFNNDPEFPFIREIIETKKTSDQLISFQAFNLIKREMQDVIKDIHSIGDAEEVMGDNKMSHALEGMLKMKREKEDAQNSDVTALGWDLNSYSIKKRNERLYITEDPINGKYENFNIFSGTSRFKKDVEKMNKVQRGALPFEEDRNYNPNGMGYFMGEPLENIMKGENICDLSALENNLVKFYKILDNVNHDIPDEDFIHEDYLISEFTGMDGNIYREYHWDTFNAPLNDPQVYKLVRNHPKVVDDFFNKKNEALDIPSGIYPEKLKREYTEAKKHQAETIKEAKTTNKSILKTNVQEKKLYIDGYSKSYDKYNNLVDLSLDETDPYQSVGMVFQKKEFKMDAMALIKGNADSRKRNAPDRNTRPQAPKYKPKQDHFKQQSKHVPKRVKKISFEFDE